MEIKNFENAGNIDIIPEIEENQSIMDDYSNIEELKSDIQDLRIEARFITDFYELKKKKMEIKKLVGILSQLSGNSMKIHEFKNI